MHTYIYIYIYTFTLWKGVYTYTYTYIYIIKTQPSPFFLFRFNARNRIRNAPDATPVYLALSFAVSPAVCVCVCVYEVRLEKCAEAAASQGSVKAAAACWSRPRHESCSCHDRVTTVSLSEDPLAGNGGLSLHNGLKKKKKAYSSARTQLSTENRQSKYFSCLENCPFT